MTLIKKSITVILIILISFIISSIITVLLFNAKMLWLGTIILCLSLVLFEGIIFIGCAGIPVIFSKTINIKTQEKVSDDFFSIMITYCAVFFFIAFFVFSIAFVKSYQMSQIMIFVCWDVCPPVLSVCLIGFRRRLGFSVSILGNIKIWHLALLIFLFISTAGFKITEYNPAFFHVNYKAYISKSSMENIGNDNILKLKFSYQTMYKNNYTMHLSVKSDKKLLFGKFGHGIVYGKMSFDKDGKIILDIYDSDFNDGDPEITFNTKTAKLTYLNKDKDFFEADIK